MFKDRRLFAFTVAVPGLGIAPPPAKAGLYAYPVRGPRKPRAAIQKKA